jgi:hypothetical protein
MGIEFAQGGWQLMIHQKKWSVNAFVWGVFSAWGSWLGWFVKTIDFPRGFPRRICAYMELVKCWCFPRGGGGEKVEESC